LSINLQLSEQAVYDMQEHINAGSNSRRGFHRHAFSDRSTNGGSFVHGKVNAFAATVASSNHIERSQLQLQLISPRKLLAKEEFKDCSFYWVQLTSIRTHIVLPTAGAIMRNSFISCPNCVGNSDWAPSLRACSGS